MRRCQCRNILRPADPSKACSSGSTCRSRQKGRRPVTQTSAREHALAGPPRGPPSRLGGHLGGQTGPARTPAGIAYAHLDLGTGARFEYGLPAGWTAAVVPLHGSIRIQGTTVAADTVALLGHGDRVELEATAPASLMLLAGEPIGEPIAHHGPFVMNTREEIEQAVLDYQQGRMGHLD